MPAPKAARDWRIVSREVRRKRIGIGGDDLEHRNRRIQDATPRRIPRCCHDGFEHAAPFRAPCRLVTGGETFECHQQADDLFLAHFAGTTDPVMWQAGQLRERRELRRYVNFYVGEEECPRLDGAATELSDGDEIHIIPSVAGG